MRFQEQAARHIDELQMLTRLQSLRRSWCCAGNHLLSARIRSGDAFGGLLP